MADSDDQEITDSTLLRRFRTGDQQAAAALYARYSQRLRQLAKARSSRQLKQRVDEDDLVQTVFRTLFRRVKDDPRQQVPRGDELWKLLLAITLNKIRRNAEHHFAAKRDVRASRDDEAVPLHELPAKPSTTTLLEMSMREVVAQLSPLHQRVLELRIQGHEVDEIALRVDCSTRTIERVLQEIRQNLRSLFSSSFAAPKQPDAGP